LAVIKSFVLFAGFKLAGGGFSAFLAQYRAVRGVVKNPGVLFNLGLALATTSAIAGVKPIWIIVAVSGAVHRVLLRGGGWLAVGYSKLG
jgi:hypothetical protein